MEQSCNNCLDSEISLGEITEMMVRPEPVPEILRVLCAYASQDAGLHVAFFLLENLNWSLAAKSDMSPDSAGALLRIDPERLSEGLLNPSLKSADYAGHPFEGGWARNLFSGAGELLGMIVTLCDAPAVFPARTVIRMELVCRLATLAVEQANRLGELALSIGQETKEVPGHAWDSETSVQEVIQMIARQSPPREILAALCNHLSDVAEERQIAFFLIQEGEWLLAAKGPLTAESEVALARIGLETLYEKVFELSDPANHADWLPADGWAKSLSSATGELVGLLVGFEGKFRRGAYWRRVDSVCRLAVLAVEQTNLIGELAFRADHDALTGLPNRGYLERALRHAVRQSVRSNRLIALLYINLDRFRLVNDVIGLAIGNRLLEQVGHCLAGCLPAGPVLARMGGDEFAVLLPSVGTAEDGGILAAHLLKSLTRSFAIDEHELFVNASIGISCSTVGSTPESLEREAYLALYAAKRLGKARAIHFDSSMAAVSPERLEMERRLRSAISRNEFVVYYQPQIELATGRVSGLEALVRWRPEGLGLVAPSVFIPILEETGLIAEVGRWILGESCRQGKEWLDRAGVALRIGVNVSALQLMQPDFERQVELALAETGFPPELLELELTESLFVGEFGPAAAVLKKLHGLGVAIALDDFGTGQSSLSYVHKLPFQRLKIDQAFIRGVTDIEECPPIVRNIIGMAASLRMDVVAEGVETPHQAELLRLEGCEVGQGYFFSQPRPACEIVDFCYQLSAVPALS